jgi:acyl-CoA synthetase (AMP-forming)/AMP-acid ligase II
MTRLEAALPAHMLPRSLHALDGFPLNANGKTDRAALRDWLATRVGADGSRP